MNKNYPLTGDVDVVFRAYSAYTLNGRSYEEGEPVAYIRKTQVNLMYSGSPKTADAVRNLTSFTDTAPESVSVEANVFKDAILRMFGEPIDKEFVSIFKTYEGMTDSSGSLFLDSNLDKVFVYNELMEKQSSFTVDSESGQVSGLLADTFYFIDYSIKKTDYKGFALNQVSLPYLTIDITGNVMIEGKSRKFLIKIPRAKLDTAPNFNFASGSFSSTTMVYKIISNKNMSGVDIYFY